MVWRDVHLAASYLWIRNTINKRKAVGGWEDGDLSQCSQKAIWINQLLHRLGLIPCCRHPNMILLLSAAKEEELSTYTHLGKTDLFIKSWQESVHLFPHKHRGTVQSILQLNAICWCYCQGADCLCCPVFFIFFCWQLGCRSEAKEGERPSWL